MRTRLPFRIASGWLALLLAAPAVAQRPLPEVHVIATGGTIASTPDGSLSGDALIAALPGLDTLARVSVEQFANVGSSQITPEHWLGLSRRIAEVFRARPALAGVVVTHGTDTMEETAYFLHLTVPDPRPVVVTGAMRPARAIGADGPANLVAAIRAAAHPDGRGRPGLVLMDDELHAAHTVTKTNTTRVDAFVSTSGGPLGVVDPDAVVWHVPPSPGPLRGAFALDGVEALPRVDIVYSYAGADGAALPAYAEAGARGLVLASVGRGNLPRPQREGAREAARRGLLVAVSSRVNGGRVPVEPVWVPALSGGRELGEGPSARGALFGAGELNPHKARVLLMLALTRSSDPTDVARLFDAR